jgi:Flp pilus assembly protein TadG
VVVRGPRGSVVGEEDDGMTREPARRDRGAAAVEFAIILPILLLLIAGIIDLGRMMYTEVVLSNAAREGSRMIALGYSTADAQTRVDAAAINIGTATATVTATCPASPVPTDGASVQVTSDFEWLLLGDVVKMIPGGSLSLPSTLSATGTMRCLG